jgi:Putative DNA-binding domain
MLTLREVQAAFAAGVLDPSFAGRIAGAIDGDGLAPERRLAIYRNNTLASLRGLLERTFPATRHLLGPERFVGIARAFIRSTPPDHPQLAAYGAGFPEFLEVRAEAGPVAHVADVARLEWAREEAYYAADAPPLEAAAVARIPVERYPKLRLSLHPSVRLVRSAGPVHSLWQAALAGVARPPPVGTPEQALVVRPEMTVVTRPIEAGDLVLLEALGLGLRLAEAAARAQAGDPEFDLQRALASHLVGGTFAGCG